MDHTLSGNLSVAREGPTQQQSAAGTRRFRALLPLVCALVATSAHAAADMASASTPDPRSNPVGARIDERGGSPGSARIDERGATGGAAAVSLDHELSEIERMIATAHFRTALAMLPTTRELLHTDGAQDASQRARLEVAAATAEIALGQRERAVESLQRALRADRALRFDPTLTSPKLLDLLTEARRIGPPAGTLR